MAGGVTITQALGLIGLGCIGGAALAWVAFKISDAIERVLDEAFGDEEAAAARKITGGDSEAASSSGLNDVRTHRNGGV